MFEVQDLRAERDEMLREIQVLHETVAALTALADESEVNKQIEVIKRENQRLRDLLTEACAEIAQWKTEALDRRQRMVKAQNESLVRVPLMGVVK